MADIFVSYKKEDRALTQDVITQLQKEGFSVWWDDRLTPRERWDAMIEKELDAAKAVLVLWTPRAVTSEWVRNEAAVGKDAGKLIPVRMEACTLPVAFRFLQTADLTRWEGDDGNPEWQRTLTWIRDLAGAAADKPELPPAPKPDAETQGLQARISTLLAEIADLLDQIEDLKARNAAIDAEMTEAGQARQAQMDRLRKDMQEGEQRETRLRTEILRLKKELEEEKSRAKPPVPAKPGIAPKRTQINGRWKVTIESHPDETELVFDFEAFGRKLLGRQIATRSVMPIKDGVIDGTRVSWVLSRVLPAPLTWEFVGVFDGSRIQGEVDWRDVGSFAFRAERS